MKKYLLLQIKIVLAVVILTFTAPAIAGACFAVWGEETTSVQTSKNGVTFTVEYPTVIKCNEPTTFSFSTTGGSGNYKYRLYNVMIYDGSEYVSVYDVSYGNNSAYFTNDYYQFTFTASGDYYIRFSMMDMGTYTTISTGLYDIKLSIRDEKYPSVEEIVESVSRKCIEECGNEASEYDKALWLHDWIIDNCKYDYSYSYCSAEGALSRGLGTCEAYHRAYVMLLNKVGIQTGRIVGNGHVWTAVKIDNKWYQIDPTWNDAGYTDPNINLQHMYFAINDEIMSLVHNQHKSVAGYESTSLEQNYFIKSREILKFSDPYKEKIIENLNAGNGEFTIPFIDKAMNADYRKVLLRIAAYELENTDFSGRKINCVYTEEGLKVSEIVENVRVENASLTCNGKIGLNLEVEIPEKVSSNDASYASLTINGETQNSLLKNIDKEGSIYTITVYLTAKQVRDVVSLEIYNGSDNEKVKITNANDATGYAFEYSVADFVALCLDPQSGCSEQLKEFATAVMEYGDCSATYFDYGDDSSRTVSEPVKSISASEFEEKKKNISGDANGIMYRGSSLILGTDVAIRHYFSVTDGTSVNDFSFELITDNGTALLAPTEKDGLYYVEICNISPVDYDKMFRVRVDEASKTDENDSGLEIEYGVFSYGYEVLSRSADEKLGNVLGSMYLANAAAKKYFVQP